MSSSPYPAPPGCTQAPLGARATQSLGHPPSPAIAAHLADCPACRLQRVAFARLGAHPVPPPPDLRTRLRALVASSQTRQWRERS